MAATTISRRRRPLPRPGAHASALALWALFVALFVCLALQLRANRDPVAKADPRVVIRRVVVLDKGAPAPGPAPAAPAPAPVITRSS